MCPPGVDQTTRTSQRWQILAPRIKQIRKISKEQSYRSPTFDAPEYLVFNEDNRVLNFWRYLARAAAIPCVETRYAANGSRMSRLESLPSEVLALILEDVVLEKKDVIALGFASPGLWPHVVNHIAKNCWLAQAPLAGVEMACTGTYLTDLPATFAKHDLAARSTKWRAGGRMCMARQINWAAVSEYEEVQDAVADWQTAADACRDQLAESVYASVSEELLLACGDASAVSFKKEAYVLRNLTTRQYVHCTSDGYITHAQVKNLHLNDVMLLNICWTAKYRPWPHTSVSAEEQRLQLGKHQGPWAGHCFDIVPWTVQEQELDLEEWTDYTLIIVDHASKVATCHKPPINICSRARPADLSLKRKYDSDEGESEDEEEEDEEEDED
ncbi:hypothetical protein PVAG01_01985 [Phlyctema vagabunda]|uniref:F-box domain-containing protein n=1 Tax=Phlyctema vagabunda TaxID=108571 RepID=A0ABR4PYR7_9HELO